MKYITLVLISFALGCASVDYDNLPGSSSGEIDKFIVDKMEASDKPGFSGIVLQGEKVIFHRSYGYRNIEKKLPVEDDTPFVIGSISKLFIGTAIMQLVESGELSLEEDVNKYIDFSVRNPDFPNKPITIRMLMNHSAGIGMNFPKIWFTKKKGDQVLDYGEFCKEYLVKGGKYYSGKSYMFEAGTDFVYSNVSITLLAHLIEKVSGNSLEGYLRENVWAPLDMEKTSCNFSYYGEDEVAYPYSKNILGYSNKGYFSMAVNPAAFLKSTTKDLGIFLRSFYNENRVISLESIKTMQEIQKGIKPIWWDEMGLVWQYKYIDGYKLVGHSGGFSGIAGMAFYNKEKDRTVILLMNGSWKTGKTYDRFNDKDIKEVFFKLMEL